MVFTIAIYVYIEPSCGVLSKYIIGLPVRRYEEFDLYIIHVYRYCGDYITMNTFYFLFIFI